MRPCLLIFLISIWGSNAQAFYTHESDQLSQEIRGILYGSSGFVDSKLASEISARLMYNIDLSNWHMEYHQVWQERLATTNQYQTQADRFNVSFSNESFYLKLGRQAINLATTFYFSPNDFFAPFSVQTFNRDFKQGVDALQTELQLGELSQLSLLFVNNQQQNLSTSSIVRFESAFENLSWMILAGEVNDQPQVRRKIIGGSIQTDIFDSIGIRAEGHIDKHVNQRTTEWVFGLEHRWLNELSLNLEWFNHGAKSITNNLPYSGSQYLAVGLSYPFTPLLNGSFSVIRNMDDYSRLHTAYINYSLSNESTVSIYVLQPTGQSIITEFSHVLPVVGLELFLYF